MGTTEAPEIETWLRAGGWVVTASERAARFLVAAFHRARRAEGLSAWPAPKILDWKSFVLGAWSRHSRDPRLLLSPIQEKAIWTEIVGKGDSLATLLEGPRARLASMAMDAHGLLCAYAPHYLKAASRSAWDQDAAEFSRWLTGFDQACRAGNLLSGARLPLELLTLLEDSGSGSTNTERPRLLLVGFDRILPVQRGVFNGWGEWQEVRALKQAVRVAFYETADSQQELAACAIWCKRHLQQSPNARILVVTQDLATRRGEIERAFLNHTDSISSSRSSTLFEFSLGAPLSKVALAKGAHLLLRWLSGAVQEHELDWLISTGQAAAKPDETAALQKAMRKVRRQGLEQPRWKLAEFMACAGSDASLEAWVARMTEAQHKLRDFSRRPQAPLDWAESLSLVLQLAAWPGASTLSSSEFQAVRRWTQAVETTGSLGFDGQRMSWPELLSALSQTLDETLFAPESSDSPILIAGPAESAGTSADAVWFLGADEEAWPATGSTHPLLPLDVQRKAGMPHATAQLDWELANAMTTRLLTSADEVHFSYAKQREGTETRPSRMITQHAGIAQPLPADLLPPAHPDTITVKVREATPIPFPHNTVHGGATILTNQSLCPFKAFATARLAAESWDRAEPSLTAKQRGMLLHTALRSVWSGPPGGIRSLEALLSLADRRSFVASHVRLAFNEKISRAMHVRLPQAYLALEEERLTGLVTEWLDYEAMRLDFAVAGTEVPRPIEIAGLSFNVRLDRIDELSDGSLLIIDYKTGLVSPKLWALPRPEDVQLPLYAGFALKPGEALGGLVFARMRTGEPCFAGSVFNPSETLFGGLKGSSTQVKNKLTHKQLSAWQQRIEALAHDFVAGKAEVDPRQSPLACDRCELQVLCRIQERPDRGQLEADDAPEDEDADE